MDSSLDELAKKKPFGVNSEFENYFNELDNVCTSNDNYGTCELFKNMDVDESVKLEMQQILTTLKRSISQKNIYLRDTSSLKYDSCMYYKYWFYLKLIKDNTGKINISRIKRAWQRKQNIIYPFPHEPCRFHANTMEDIKILKILYDYIFFSNSARDTYNLISDIQKCEYCKHLKNYLERTFKKFPIECAHSSSNAFCVDYNVHFKQIINLDELSSLSCENDEILSQCPLYSNTSKQASEDRTSDIGEGEIKISNFPGDNVQFSHNIYSDGSYLENKNVIGGISVLGISFVLFFLYKFTSFRSLICRRTGWITKMWKNPYGDKEELLLRDSATNNINSGNI
ncbi:PIR Superfamily Protein, partial [Plasmodium ovale curtisi]